MAGGIGAYSSQDVFAQDARRRAEAYARANYVQQAGYPNQALQQQYLDEMSLMAAQQPQQVQPEAKGHRCTDGKDDGKIGWSAVGHALKGAGKFIGGLLGFEWNPDGTYKGHSFGKLVKNVAIGAGVALLCFATAGTAIPVVLAAGGAAMATASLANSTYKAFTAKSDAEAKAAWEGVGADTLATALSVTGVKASLNSYNAAKGLAAKDYSGIKGSWEAFKDSGKITKDVVVNGAKEVKAAYQSNKFTGVKDLFVDKVSNLYSTAKTNLGQYVKSPSNAATRQQTQEQTLKDLDDQIALQDKKVAKLKDGSKSKAKAQAKLDELKTQRQATENAYKEINSKTSFDDANDYIQNLDKQIAEKRKSLFKNDTEAYQKPIKAEIERLTAESKVAKQVLDQRLSEAKYVRDQISSVEKKFANETDAKRLEILEKQYDDLVLEQQNLKFDIPEAQSFKTNFKARTESVKDVGAKQLEVSKKQAEVVRLEAKTKVKDYDGSLDADLFVAKAELELAKYDLSIAQAESASSGRFASAASRGSNVTSYVSTAVKDSYGKSPVFNSYIKKIPYLKNKEFMNLTMPSSVPVTYATAKGIEDLYNTVTFPFQVSSQLEQAQAMGGVTPQQLDTFYKNKAALDNLYAMYQSQGYPQYTSGYGYYPQTAQQTQGVNFNDMQKLEASMDMLGVI